MPKPSRVISWLCAAGVWWGAGPCGGTVLAATGVLQFGTVAHRKAEAGGVARLSVLRYGGVAGEIQATVSTSDGTAVRGSDYVPVTTNLVFGRGVFRRFVYVPLLNDFSNEPDETLKLTLSGEHVGRRTNATLTIRDDDPAGILNFSASRLGLKENAGLVRLVVTRTGGRSDGVSVTLRTVDDAATGGEDFSPVETNLVFGRTEARKVVDVPIRDDDLPEGTETFRVTLSDPTGGAPLGAMAVTDVTLFDNEPAIGFSRPTYVVSEAGRQAIVTILRSGPLTAAASVDCATTGGTGLPGADYQAVSRTVVFPIGVAARFIAVPVMDNRIDDNDKTVVLTLSNPTNVLLGTIEQTEVMIADNDVGGVIELRSANYDVPSTAGRVVVWVRRTGGVADAVTVRCETEDGTAVGDVDYRPVATNLVFSAGQRARRVAIAIPWDYAQPRRETFQVKLSEPTGGGVLGAITNALVGINVPAYMGPVGEPQIKATASGLAFYHSLFVNGVRSGDPLYLYQFVPSGESGGYLSIQSSDSSSEVDIGSDLWGSKGKVTTMKFNIGFPVSKVGVFELASRAATFTVEGEEVGISGSSSTGYVAAESRSGRVVIDTFETYSNGHPQVVGGRFDLVAWSNQLGRYLLVYGYFRVRF